MVGIITLYYDSINYGGVLQAFALCKAIEKYTRNKAEQICFSMINREQSFNKNDNKKGLFARIKKYHSILKILLVLKNKLSFKISDIIWGEKQRDVIKIKKKNFTHFVKEIIPHSISIYDSTDIFETLNKYDAFITGSDQVWNFAWYSSVFFLDFVPSDKIKLSYAASISKDSLTENEKEIFKRSLADFKAVSVRETQAVDLIKDLSPVEPKVVLDPTLLLSREDWDKICASRVVPCEYLFCYFLGNNMCERKLALKFAKAKHLKIVSVPLTGRKIYSDLKFGDIIMPTASPEEFLSLVKHASYVFTDSFHATVFSQIFQKQYFVFNRDKNGTMNSRIFNITDIFNSQERFCNGKERETLKYIQTLKNIDYNKENQKFSDLKEFSINYLKEALEQH